MSDIHDCTDAQNNEGIKDVSVKVDGSGKGTVDPEVVIPDLFGNIDIYLSSEGSSVKWVFEAADPIKIANGKDFEVKRETPFHLHIHDTSDDKKAHPTHKYVLYVAPERGGATIPVSFVDSRGVEIDPTIKDR